MKSNKEVILEHNWINSLPIDPVPKLLQSGDTALAYFVQRDLLEKPSGPVGELWELAEAKRLVRKQNEDGSWRYQGSGPRNYPYFNYNLLETYRNLGVLVELFGFDEGHPATRKAADYIFSCQTEEGDIRGILGEQYIPYYHGAILELLVKAGYTDDARLIRGLDWLLDMRQQDGGWIVPVQAVPAAEKTEELWSSAPLPPERQRPSSHLATGMVLRALAAHPAYRHKPQTKRAAELLKSRFFQADKYNDRKAPHYWTKFQFPFWWSNLLTALDTLSLMGVSQEDADIQAGLDWFVTHQEPDGLWPIGYGKNKKVETTRCWVGLAVCRVFARFSAQAGN